jgi:hypothetical protein
LVTVFAAQFGGIFDVYQKPAGEMIFFIGNKLNMNLSLRPANGYIKPVCFLGVTADARIHAAFNNCSGRNFMFHNYA